MPDRPVSPGLALIVVVTSDVAADVGDLLWRALRQAQRDDGETFLDDSWRVAKDIAVFGRAVRSGKEVVAVAAECTPGLSSVKVESVNEIDAKTFAARRGCSVQAVTKRARAGKIEGARQDDRRRWWIPIEALEAS